ncbi:uncharacterized protein LOC121368547 [Gigantopelta aegis]|uniref:uncharacterized protein LOC121368547 n=1 Tax=Gigantopelta aegis TaxID=1735272 RepID=UPI001B889B92|nr:uncharacterized protein LOC121368547 [Gigantopelta aegis]
MTRNDKERRFHPEKQNTTKEILKSELKKKRKTNLADDFNEDSSSNEGRKTPFMKEYEYKMTMNRRFEDEGFWDDPATKATAVELFGLDLLDELLYGRDVEDSERRTDGSENDKDSEKETFKDIEDYGDSCPKKSISPAMKSASDSSVTFPDSDAESKTRLAQRSTNDAELRKDKARVRSAIRRLLTERLFGLTNGGGGSTSGDRGSTMGGGESTRGGRGSTRGGDRSAIGGGGSTNGSGGSAIGGGGSTNVSGGSAIGGGGSTDVSSGSAIGGGGSSKGSGGSAMINTNQGKSKVVFVDEYSESADALSPLSSNSGLPPMSGSILPSLAPRSTSHPNPGLTVSDQSTILADGLEKDKIFINRAQKSHIHWFKTDYNGGPERRFVKHVDNTQNLVEMVPSPYHPVPVRNPTAPITFVSKRDVNVSKAPIRYTSRSRHVDVLSMDEWRLRKLLEELYKDKKYMDLLLHKQGKPSYVNQLAHYGRDYLLQIADFWESKGILPPRPDQNMADSQAPVRSKTSLSLNAESKDSKPDASRLGLDMNKTVC